MGGSALRADVRLPSIFSDHMVLQKAEVVPIWGKADPGEHVRVTVDGRSAEVDAEATGRWKVTLNLKESGSGPFTMTVAGKNVRQIEDVVVGEVWLASGQSNMELPLRVTTGADAEIAQSANPLLRQFLVKKAGAKVPAEDCVGQWTIAGPETSGEFTAVGYYFGKELQQSRRLPVGIIHSSHGGTFIEPWIAAEAFERIPAFRASAEAARRKVEEFPGEKAKFVADFATWLKRHAREDDLHPDPAPYADEAASPADWTTVNLPGPVTAPGFPASGVFWIRRDIDVTALVAQQGFKVMIGPLHGDWQVYWNGRKIDEMTYSRLPGKDFPCYFPVPRESIRAGRNTLAIRLYSPASSLNFPDRSLWAGPIDLNGKWLAKVERSFPELSSEVMAAAPRLDAQPPEAVPGALFNAMIHPLVPYRLAGVLWYQGESNVKRAEEYRTAFPALITGWREQWQQPDLPFYFCQLCNNAAKVTAPGESAWAELRESQAQALALPATGQAVIIDVGEAGDLHPRDKQTVGHRLFLIAAGNRDGHSLSFSGPIFDSSAIDGGQVRVKFRHGEGGLVAKELPSTYIVKSVTGETAPLIRNSPGSELEGFAICGADHKWTWAQAKIDGDSVLVWSDKVPQPAAVRYAWADNPTVNLYNRAGLPAAPFRTDDFPLTTKNAHF